MSSLGLSILPGRKDSELQPIGVDVLDGLFEISSLLLNREASVEQIIRTLTTKSAQITGSDVGAYFTVVDGEWKLAFFHGADADTQHALTEIVASLSETQLRCDDVATDPRFLKIGQDKLCFWLRSFLAVPISDARGGRDGAIILCSNHRRAFGESHTSLMRDIATKASASFENMRQFRMMRQEIAERRRVEAELVALKERYELATESHEIGIFDCDLITDSHHWTERNEKNFGLEPGAFVRDKHNFYELIHQDDREMVREAILEATHNRKERTVVEFRVPRGKKVGIIYCTARFSYNEAGLPLRMVGCTRDVTKRRRIEYNMLASERRMRATYEQANIGISEVDRNGRYVMVNDLITKMTGYTNEEMYTYTFFDLSPAGYQENERELYAEIVKGDKEAYTVERQVQHKNGDVRWVEVSVSAVRDHEGRFLYGIRVAKPIDDRKNAEKARKLLMDELSHRVKNTMATIISVAKQTGLHSKNMDDFNRKFQDRLEGIAATHTLLTDDNWCGASLGDIIKAELMPFHGEDTLRWLISGPELKLQPATTVAVGMIIHELATNAVKYGALSESGHVSVSWFLRNDDNGVPNLDLEWHENDGPEIENPPIKCGFGTKLLKKVSRGLGASLEIDYLRTGVLARLRMPLVS